MPVSRRLPGPYPRARARASSISCVISTIPVSVRRNHLASSLGSCPTTRPSGTITPESMTQFDSSALRFTITRGSATTYSRLEKLCVRTPVNSSELRISEPDTMQSPDTSDEIACPRRPSSLWMNFAGGTISE